MIDRLIIFLIRRKFGLKKYEKFRFTNQKSKDDFYWFTDKAIMKCLLGRIEMRSSVSLNWLLDDECEIVRCE